MTLKKHRRKQGFIAAGLVVLLLLTDQLIKIWIKTHMVEHQMYNILPWFKIYFLENEGMAYGIKLGSKLFLTVFRIIAMSVAAWFVFVLVKQNKFKTSFIATLALIVAGGIGNILDSIFYGACFSSSVGQVAQWVAPGTGYASWFHGKVVDMFYFPIIQTTYPSWFPWKAGEQFVFFSPVFNFADACISVGLIALILFYPHTLSRALDSVLHRNRQTTGPTDIL
ncbi:peptidase A8 [Porphyromonas macacae]|uniref:Lipoprotein signal peptidase n=1 Tax=Porphyromonas macacae TaxID=28115 RepID=A0A0A2E769_9PORP|nr:lipoprotein signal peptidase [Porphyromonas macacae]KGN74758.1 peptidase A8 [Porphyromonas macacae]SUB77300.1 lipoprotein signal peptidase [Porphyromonas macacae]SUB88297.1 lipoprotein signal peptidase [Porphyromonas macacae]